MANLTIPPTARQLEVLRFIAERIKAHMPPTIREICAHFGWLSTQATDYHVRQLRRKGLLEESPGRISRGLALTDAGWNLVDAHRSTGESRLLVGIRSSLARLESGDLIGGIRQLKELADESRFA